MNINKKVLLFFVSIGLIIVVFLTFLIQNRVNNSLVLEENFTQKSIKKLYHVFYSNSKYLKNIGYEYSKNNELNLYLEQRDASSLEKYFQDDYMKELNLSHFAIFDKNRNYVYGDSYDMSSDELFDTPSELISFMQEKELEKYIKSSSNIKYMTLDYEKVIFHIRKLLNKKGEILGYMYFARTIDSDFLSDMSSLLQNYISLIPSYFGNDPKIINFNNVINIEYQLYRANKEVLFSYINLYDESSNKNFYIRMKSTRELYQEIISSISTILVGVSLCFIILIMLFYIFMSGIFTKRIINITNSVKEVVNNQNLEMKIETTYDDEITYLANKLNEMFIIIDAKQHEEIKRERDFLQSILDTQDNIVVIAKGNKIHSVNKKFTDVFSSQENFLTNIALLDKESHRDFVNIAQDYSKKDKTAKFKLLDSDKYFTFNVSKIDLKRHLISINDVSTFNEKILNLENRVLIDPLTGVYNKETMTDIVKETLKSQDFHLAIVDIDFFKKVNDTYGHLIGDYILRDMTQLIVSIIPKEDLFGRIGGEEFMFIIKETNKENIKAITMRVRKIIEEYEFVYDDVKLKITLSIGCTRCQDDDDYKSIYKRADIGLYRAKHAGRNQVVYI